MRRFLLIIIPVAIIIAAIWFYCNYYDQGSLRISITQQEIDNVLAEKFPKRKKFLKVISVRYHNPKCELIDGSNRVRIAMDVTLTAGHGLGPLEKNFDGSTIVTCGIGYDPTTHRILIKEAAFEKIDIPKVKPEHLAIIEEAATLTATEFFDTIPVYQIKERKPAETLARMVLKDIRISNRKLHLHLGL